MALPMGAVMAVIMLSFMGTMDSNRAANFGNLAGATLVFTLPLWLVRSQTTVEDVARMKAIIPHHSISILTSGRAGIIDPRVHELAETIIEIQRREIAGMRALTADLEE